MRVLFFGDGLWAAHSLLRIIKDGHQVDAVVIRTSPSDRTLSDAAKDLNIEILQPESVNSTAFQNKIASISPDLNFSCSYDQIIGKITINSAPLGFVNVHAGKLPFYRGRNVINWAIINGESEIGITAHYIDENIDTGNIISQTTIPLSWTDTYSDVLQNLTDVIPRITAEVINSISTGQVNSTPQSHLPGTYFCKREDGDEWIDWAESSVNIYNKIRGITRPGPGATTIHNRTPVILWTASYQLSWPKYRGTPGQVVGQNKDGCLVKTGDSTVLIREVQIGSQTPQKPMWSIGTRLGLNTKGDIQSILHRICQLEQIVQNLSKDKPV